jgi:hypothetical protein
MGWSNSYRSGWDFRRPRTEWGCWMIRLKGYGSERIIRYSSIACSKEMHRLSSLPYSIGNTTKITTSLKESV